MSGKTNRRRNLASLLVSFALHGLLLSLIISQIPPDYYLLPTPAAPEQPVPTNEPAIDVRIMKMPLTPPKILPPTPTPPKPAPPRPTPPVEAQPVVPAHPTIIPPTPAPPTPPTPPSPTPAPPKPPPPKPAPVAPPLPAPTPQPVSPKPATTPANAPPAPTQAQSKPAAAAATAPSPLNVHKAAQAAPAGVPTLPMAPAAGPAGKPGSPAASAAAQAGAPGASRLNGLSPYPYGFMPNGGGGLRGTLVGCANAEAVHLSSAERDKCNERFGVDMTAAPKLDPLSPAKRATFDKSRDRDAAWTKYRDSGAGAAGPSMPGGIDHGPASSEILDHPASDYPPK